MELALMWVLEMIWKCKPESGRNLTATWVISKATVWVLEMVREYRPMSDRL
jgi:hypothetical protein